VAQALHLLEGLDVVLARAPQLVALVRVRPEGAVRVRVRLARGRPEAAQQRLARAAPLGQPVLVRVRDELPEGGSAGQALGQREGWRRGGAARSEAAMAGSASFAGTTSGRPWPAEATPEASWRARSPEMRSKRSMMRSKVRMGSGAAERSPKRGWPATKASSSPS
jgi:hypothetical protein